MKSSNNDPVNLRVSGYVAANLASDVLPLMAMELQELSEAERRSSRASTGRRILLLVNRQSGRGESDLDRCVALLEEHGFCVVAVPLERAGDIGDTIMRHGDQVDMVVLGGGDGTMNAAVPALLETGIPLGILPLGTANDLARTLGIPSSLDDACAVIAARHTRAIDVAYVNGRHFINDASLGLSVEVSRRAERASKRRWGVLSYAAQAFAALRSHGPFRAVIYCDGVRARVSAVQITVGNGRYYGGGLTISSDASIDDGMLDLCALAPMSIWRLLRLGPFMWTGSHDGQEGVRIWRGREIRVETGRPMQVNTDGEHATRTPARFWVQPRALTVLVPPADAASLGAAGERAAGKLPGPRAVR